MTNLPMGANTAMTDTSGDIVVTHRADPGIDVNLTAFLVTEAGRVRSDADMVFYNQPLAENGSATFREPTTSGGVVRHALAFDLTRLPTGVAKIVVALTEDRADGFGDVSNLTAELVAADSTIRLLPVPALSSEKGLMVAEIYRRGDQFKLRAIWQGYRSGLFGLATAHGVEVEPPSPSAPEPPAPAATSAVSFKKVTGRVDMKKGDKPIVMEKTDLITASVAWRSGTDYDVYGLVMTRDGRQIDVATFGAKKVKPLMDYGNGAVRHLGDVRRGGGSGEQTETLEIRLRPEILAVVPVAYSAQSNGTGSFYRYRVSLRIDNGSGTQVNVSAENANDNDRIYSCVPGIIYNDPDGVVVEPVELYSAPNSENRPQLRLTNDGRVDIAMDAGPKNKYK